MAKKIFLIIFLLLIAYGIWSFINIMGARIRYGAIRDQVKAIVKFTTSDTDSKIRQKIRFKAEEQNIPLTDEDIEISRYDHSVTIYVSYSDSVVLPFGLKTIYYDQEIEISPEDVEE
jgi:hypothetical protein